MNEVVPVLSTLGAFALVFGIVYMNKKENLAMIERGMNPRQPRDRSTPTFVYLKWGLLLVGAGTGLLAAGLINLPQLMGSKLNPIPYFSLPVIGGGIGLIISYIIESRALKQKKATPPPSPSEL